MYRVAEVSQSGWWYTLLPDYEESGADVNNLATAKDGRIAAETLTAWVQTQHLSPDARQSTDSKGIASASRLPTGLYLVIGERTRIGDNVYTCSPSLVAIPEWSAEAYGWNYAVTIEPKNTPGGTISDNPGNIPDQPNQPDSPNQSNKPNQPNKKPTPSGSTTNKTDKNLPNTGVLQWPIPTLAGIGVVCMLLGGWLKRKKG